MQDILGLSYEHFTQSVLLPQGRFSEFLHAKAADRQDLLVELLAFGVYDQIGQQARERAELAADGCGSAQAARARASPTRARRPRAEAAARVQALAELAATVDERLAALRRAHRSRPAGRPSRPRAVRDEAPAGRDAGARRGARAWPSGSAAPTRWSPSGRKQRDSAEQAEVEAAAGARGAAGQDVACERLREAYAEHAGSWPRCWSSRSRRSPSSRPPQTRGGRR